MFLVLIKRANEISAGTEALAEGVAKTYLSGYNVI
jgi:hypothetical protein